MTIQLDALVLDFAKLEEFAGKVSADQGRGVQRHPRLSRGPPRSLAWASFCRVGHHRRVAEHTGISERYLQEWLSAQAANGYLRYDAATQLHPLRRGRRRAGRGGESGRFDGGVRAHRRGVGRG